MVYDYGAKAELDEWARVVGDDLWKWDNAKEKFKEVCSVPFVAETLVAGRGVVVGSRYALTDLSRPYRWKITTAELGRVERNS